MARPTKLTPEVEARILTALATGEYLETAAAFAGINRETLRAWINRGGKARSGIYHTFAQRVLQARAEWRVIAMGRIASAAQAGQWQADAWRLERTHPHLYGRRTPKADDNRQESARGAVLDLIETLREARRNGQVPATEDHAPPRAADG